MTNSTRPLRLLFVAPGFPKISETFVTDQVIGLSRMGHHVDVFTTNPGSLNDPGLRQELAGAMGHLHLPPGTKLDPELSWLPQRRQPTWWHPRTKLNILQVLVNRQFWSLRYPLRQGAALLGQPAYDAIVCHFGPAGVMLQAMRDIGLIKAPMVTIFHGYDITNCLGQVPDTYYNNLFARGDMFLPISDRWYNRLLELGCPEERTQVQRLGTDLQTFAHAMRTAEPGQPLQLLSVARLVEKKGIEYGIKAVARLNGQGIDTVYNIVGDGPLRSELEALAGKLGISQNVNFLGARAHAEIATLMTENNILLVPSVTDARGGMEGIPVVIMEAMATGLLVVASRHSGIPEIVHHEKNGLLAAERDDEGLASCLASVHRDQQRWQDLVNAAHGTVHTNYDLHRQNAALAEILSQLNQPARSGRS